MKLKVSRFSGEDIHLMSLCWADVAKCRQFIEASCEWLDTVDPGDIVVFSDADTNRRFGVTGWYPLGNGSAFMRWHGVLPEHRGRRISVMMLAWLLKHIRTHYGIERIYETCDSESTVQYFVRLGFNVVTDVDIRAAVFAESGDFKYLLVRSTKEVQGDSGPMG